jgi:hypothetical protein
MLYFGRCNTYLQKGADLMEKLKLANICQDTEANVEQGPNIVIYITLGAGNFNNKNKFKPRYYWRLSDPGRKDLLSIDVDSSSGEVIMAELTAYSGILYPLLKTGNNEIITISRGVPAFDLSFWNALLPETKGPVVYDVPSKFLLQLGQDEMRIELFSDPIKHCVITNNKIVFEFNGLNELCALTLKRFNTDKQAQLIKAYEKRKAI